MTKMTTRRLKPKCDHSKADYTVRVVDIDNHEIRECSTCGEVIDR